MKENKWTKTELIKNHMDCKRVIEEMKTDCYDKMEVALVDLLLKENKQLLLEKIKISKRLENLEKYND